MRFRCVCYGSDLPSSLRETKKNRVRVRVNISFRVVVVVVVGPALYTHSSTLLFSN